MWNLKSVISGPVYSPLSTQLLSYQFVVKKVQSASLCNKKYFYPVYKWFINIQFRDHTYITNTMNTFLFHKFSSVNTLASVLFWIFMCQMNNVFIWIFFTILCLGCHTQHNMKNLNLIFIGWNEIETLLMFICWIMEW